MKRSLILLLALGSFSALAAGTNQFSIGERVLVKDGNYTGSINSIFLNNTVDVYVDGADQYITVTINRLVKTVECDKKSEICTGDKVNFGGELVKVKEIFANGLAEIYVKSAKQSIHRYLDLLNY